MLNNQIDTGQSLNELLSYIKLNKNKKDELIPLYLKTTKGDFRKIIFNLTSSMFHLELKIMGIKDYLSKLESYLDNHISIPQSLNEEEINEFINIISSINQFALALYDALKLPIKNK